MEKVLEKTTIIDGKESKEILHFDTIDSEQKLNEFIQLKIMNNSKDFFIKPTGELVIGIDNPREIYRIVIMDRSLK
jgi:hypothetical protein